jgi:hypothetical protein
MLKEMHKEDYNLEEFRMMYDLWNKRKRFEY